MRNLENKEDRKWGSREGARKQERKTGRVREGEGEREEIQRKDKWIFNFVLFPEA